MTKKRKTIQEIIKNITKVEIDPSHLVGSTRLTMRSTYLLHIPQAKGVAVFAGGPGFREFKERYALTRCGRIIKNGNYLRQKRSYYSGDRLELCEACGTAEDFDAVEAKLTSFIDKEKSDAWIESLELRVRLTWQEFWLDVANATRSSMPELHNDKIDVAVGTNVLTFERKVRYVGKSE